MSKDKLKEIEELAMDCLVELIDKGFKIFIKELTGYYMIRVTSPRYIEWNEIKDDYLFFVHIMLNEYKLSGRYPFTIKQKYGNAIDLTLEILKELDDDNEGLNTITMFLG